MATIERSRFEAGPLPSHPKAKIRSKMMDMEEVYLRQITEYLKRQTELQEKNNDLLKELLQNLSN